jgi:soluble lytic murein transglycosylase
MRVLEATQVYRARLNGGSAPITLEADLKRGAYGYAAHPATVLSATPGFTPPAR